MLINNSKDFREMATLNAQKLSKSPKILIITYKIDPCLVVGFTTHKL
jgi:hypothetical protein